jgi:xyloglucan fucosyltransferase
MLSLVSTFLYALLSDRVMLVHFPADFTDLFCEPFPDATWVLPPDFPVANLSDLGMNHEQSYRNLLASKKIANDPMVQSSVPPPWVFLNLCHEQDIDKLFYCSDDQLALAKVSCLLLFSGLAGRVCGLGLARATKWAVLSGSARHDRAYTVPCSGRSLGPSGGTARHG